MQGAGDLVEKIIKIVYPKSGGCEPCRKRKELLNKALPFNKHSEKTAKNA